MTARARHLRRQMTRAEVMLWQRIRLKQLGFKFRRQQPLGPFIADFYCASARVVVEIDGLSHDTDEATQRDARKDAWLREHNIVIVRLRDPDVWHNLENVIGHILRVCQGRTEQTVES